MLSISFLFSLTGLAIFFSWKVWEMNTGKILLSESALHKSDSFIKKQIISAEGLLESTLKKVADVPHILFLLFVSSVRLSLRFKNIAVAKLVKVLKLHNVKDIDRNKGSVSLFLKTISDEKKKNQN